MATLSHPNVVAVYDVEDAGPEVVIVMECVPGQTTPYGPGSRAIGRGDRNAEPAPPPSGGGTMIR